MSGPTYYRPSGRYSPLSLAKVTAVGVTAAVVCGACYGALSQINPFVYINLVGTALMGILLGKLVISQAKRHKVRSRVATIAVSGLTGVVSLYIAWVFYLYVITIQLGDPFWAWSPTVFTGMVSALLEHGAWSVADSLTPTGALLGSIWAAEAVLVITMPMYTAFIDVGPPFCEDCEEWLHESKSARIGDASGREAKLKEAVEQGNFGAFSELPQTNSNSTTMVSTHVCPGCGGSPHLHLEKVLITANNYGGNDETRVVFVPFLQLDNDTHAAVCSVIDSLVAAGSTTNG